MLKTGDMVGKFKQTLLLHEVPGIKAKRVLLISCGKESELTEAKFQDLINQMIAVLQQTAAHDVICLLPELICKNRSLAWKMRHTVIHANAALYQFNQFKSKKNNTAPSLNQITFLAHKDQLAACKQAIKEGIAIGNAMNIAKNYEIRPQIFAHPNT